MTANIGRASTGDGDATAPYRSALALPIWSEENF
jgi:hypothetical protein